MTKRKKRKKTDLVDLAFTEMKKRGIPTPELEEVPDTDLVDLAFTEMEKRGSPTPEPEQVPAQDFAVSEMKRVGLPNPGDVEAGIWKGSVNMPSRPDLSTLKPGKNFYCSACNRIRGQARHDQRRVCARCYQKIDGVIMPAVLDKNGQTKVCQPCYAKLPETCAHY